MERRRVVRVPASSANLGPGFDSFAAALTIHMELEVVETGRFAVVTDLASPATGATSCVRGFERPARTGRLRVPDHARHPAQRRAGHQRGRLRRRADGRRPPLRARRRHAGALATELEGHPDNVAAALLGGFVICADGQATRLDAPAGLEAVLVVPHEAVRTKEARAALPAEVPMADAVFNVAHGALLTLGLPRGDCDLVAVACGPLHQPYRAHLFPRSLPCSPTPATSARSARRSPAPGRRCSSGATTSRPAASSRRCGRAPRAGRRPACRSRGWGPRPGDVTPAEQEWQRASFEKVRGQGRAGPSHGGTSPRPPGGSP